MSKERESASRGSHFAKLPELIPIREEAEPRSSPTPTQTTSTSQVELALPPVDQPQQNKDRSFVESLGLSAEDERSLGLLLKTVRGEVSAALEELRTITTHDDNLEKQYKETVSENIQLQSSLDSARREIRHLKGRLSVLQMTSSEIRQERARTQQKQKRRAEQEKQVERSRSQYAEEPVPVYTAQERARTVDAKGDYIDYHKPNKGQRSRRATHPPPPPPPPPPSHPHHPHKGHTPSSKTEPLPPSLPGCSCSACNAKQSLGAVTLGRGPGAGHYPSQFTKSGQQILLGDRIIIKGEKLGTVCYIGKVDFDVLDLTYIGLHLDKPAGNCDGSVKGRRYFQCPSDHGVFIPPSQVLCVTGRTPLVGGTGLPRVREQLPKGLQISKPESRASKASAQDNNRSTKVFFTPSVQSSHSNSTVLRAKTITESELAALKTKSPGDLADDSVARMSEQMRKLAEKSKRPKTPPKEETPTVAPPTEDDLPPRPITPTPPSPLSPLAPASPPPQPSRPPTPLELTLMQALSEKDLGATGFVTANELASALTQLAKQPLSSGQVEELFQTLNIGTEEGVGLPYHSLLSLLIPAIQRLTAENQEHTA